MAKTVTLGTLRTLTRQRANMEVGQFCTDSEVNAYINLAAAELYDLLIAAYPDYYMAAPYPIALVSGTQAYSLPTTFYKLIGVDYVLDSQGNAVSLNPYQIGARNRFLFTPAFNAVGLSYLRYHLQGAQINFKPIPPSGGTVNLLYIPAFTDLSGDSDTFDTVDAWHEYVILDAAIKMLIKEESDVSMLMAQKADMKRRVEELAIARDIGAADTVTDTSRQAPWEAWSWGGMS